MADIGTLQATLGVNVSPLNRARTEFVKWGREADTQMGRATRATGSLDRAFGALGATMAAVLSTRQLVRFGKAAVATFGAMEQSIMNASTLFGGVEVDMAGLQAQIIELSSDTGLAADAIGQSLYQALSAGIPVTRDMGTAMRFVRQSSMLARAGFTDMTTAVEATAKTLNAYRMDVSEADKVHRILIQTQNRGITLVDELGSYLAQVTPIAASFGVSFENVGAALATMTAQGLRTRVAITQLRSLIVELGQSGTTGAESLLQAQQAAGLAQMSFEQLMTAGWSLGDVLNLIRDHAEKTDKSVIDLFGSVEAGQAVLSLTGANAEYLTMVFGEMATESELVQESYDRVMGTLNTQMAVAKQRAGLLGMAFGQILAPALGDAVDRMSEWLVITRMTISQKVDEYAARLSAAVKFVADNMDRLVRFTKGLIGLKLAQWLYTATGMAYGLAGALGVAATAAKALGRALIIGLAAEAIGIAIDAISELNAVVKGSAVTWGDAGIMMGQSLVNSIINTIEILVVLLPRLLGGVLLRPIAEGIRTAVDPRNWWAGSRDDKGYWATIGENMANEFQAQLKWNTESIWATAGATRIQIASPEVQKRWDEGYAAVRAKADLDYEFDDGGFFEELTNAMNSLQQELDALVIDGLTTTGAATDRYLKAMADDLRQYQDELTLMDYDGWAARRKEVELWGLALTAEITEAGAMTDELATAIESVSTARLNLIDREQADALSDAKADVEAILNLMELETSMMRSGPGAWKAYQEQSALNAEIEQWTTVLEAAGASREVIDEFIRSFKKLRKENKDAQTAVERWQDLSNRLTDSIAGSFQMMGDQIVSNILRGEKAFEDFGDLALNILEQLIHQFIIMELINPLSSWMGKGVDKVFDWIVGTENAMGNVYAQQGLVPFADGGIVTRPTIFPFAKGIGLMGEASPEAIMPLTRINGKLGVAAVGGGGGVTVNIRNEGGPLEVANQTQRSGPDGELIIDMTVRSALARLDNNGQLDGMFGRRGSGRKGVR